MPEIGDKIIIEGQEREIVGISKDGFFVLEDDRHVLPPLTDEEITNAGRNLILDSEGAKRLTEYDKRRLRKMYVTVKLPRVNPCGHRLDLSTQPRMRNCQPCWFAWFQNHGEVVQQLDEMHTEGLDHVIVALQGKKFYHRWRQFMATIAQWKAYQESLEASNASID